MILDRLDRLDLIICPGAGFAQDIANGDRAVLGAGGGIGYCCPSAFRSGNMFLGVIPSHVNRGFGLGVDRSATRI